MPSWRVSAPEASQRRIVRVSRVAKRAASSRETRSDEVIGAPGARQGGEARPGAGSGGDHQATTGRSGHASPPGGAGATRRGRSGHADSRVIRAIMTGAPAFWENTAREGKRRHLAGWSGASSHVASSPGKGASRAREATLGAGAGLGPAGGSGASLGQAEATLGAGGSRGALMQTRGGRCPEVRLWGLPNPDRAGGRVAPADRPPGPTTLPFRSVRASRDIVGVRRGSGSKVLGSVPGSIGECSGEYWGVFDIAPCTSLPLPG